jgi:hypothetical protein
MSKLWESRTYAIWASMIQRTDNPNSQAFKYYGERGIKTCAEWYEYKCFLADMGECPEGLTLERRDNDGDYSPKNCYWATRKEQANNTRNNRLIEFRGVVYTLSQLADLSGVNYSTLYLRLFVDHLPIEEAINPAKRAYPANRRARRVA